MATKSIEKSVYICEDSSVKKFVDAIEKAVKNDPPVSRVDYTEADRAKITKMFGAVKWN